MTNGKALQASVELNYQIDDSVLEKALIDNGLVITEEYAFANKRAMDLSTATLIRAIITSADMKEGEVQITQANRNSLITLRNSILTSYGIDDGAKKPRINTSRSW